MQELYVIIYFKFQFDMVSLDSYTILGAMWGYVGILFAF